MTTTFRHLMQMVDTVRYDSEALFRAIARDNPFAREVAEQFFEEAAALRCWLNEPAG
jgi:prephenate dehydrogenase